MKKITLILAPLLLVMGLQANSKKVNEEQLNEKTIQHIEIDNVERGNTLRGYSKPGAPIDMEFNSTRVKINEISDINITLTTTVNTGTLDVQLALDSNLTSITPIDENITFQITPDTKKFNIDFQVKSKNEGLFYVRMLTKVDKGYGPKLRSFAVPVYIGEKPKNLSKAITSRMKALSNGENISVSKAVETIKIINKK